MEFRQADRSDLPGILELYQHLNPEEMPLDRAQAGRIWDEEIQVDPRIAYFVAVEEGRIRATCNIVVVPNLTRGGRPWAVVENVVTHPDDLRRGLARGVMDLATNFARERGCYKVCLLSSSKREGAHRFYETIGFDPASKRAFHRSLV
ncbi:MAG: GNAT family N-acetyltransferase [Fibrobacteria bacterium]|nr:GNAT family N-acetyltransferase [Fibrobacteria bacterium]